jgi:hypothetical protein
MRVTIDIDDNFLGRATYAAGDHGSNDKEHRMLLEIIDAIMEAIGSPAELDLEAVAESIAPCLKTKFCPPNRLPGAYGDHDTSCPQQYVPKKSIVSALRMVREKAIRRAAQEAEDAIANGVTVVSAGEVKQFILHLLDEK